VKKKKKEPTVTLTRSQFDAVLLHANAIYNGYPNWKRYCLENGLTEPCLSGKDTLKACWRKAKKLR
jgi:hypothetical protein